MVKREMVKSIATEWLNFISSDEYLTTDRNYRSEEKCWLSGCSEFYARGYFPGVSCNGCKTGIEENDAMMAMRILIT